MLKRRQFLVHTPLGLVGAALTSCRKAALKTTESPPGMPPAFGTAPAVGPEVSPSTFAEAEKLVQVELTSAERAQAAGNWRNLLAPLYERRTGPRQVKIEHTVAPYSRWDPVLPGEKAGPQRDQIHLEQAWSRTTSGKRRGHRLCSGKPAGALDREAAANVRVAHVSTWKDWTASIPSCGVSSPSCVNLRWRKPKRPTRKSLPANTEARCTAFPGAPKTFSTPPAPPPLPPGPYPPS